MDGAQAIAQFRDQEGLAPDGGHDKYVDWGKMFGLPVPIPNTSARKPLIPYHDLHHWVSGYGTDELGEAYVSAWTIATGGGPFLGRMYDLGALLPGVLRAPRRTFAAFVQGRHSRNFYTAPSAHWLAMDARDLRAHARAELPTPAATAADGLAFAGVLLQALFFWGLPIGPATLFGTVLVDLWAWAFPSRAAA